MVNGYVQQTDTHTDRPQSISNNRTPLHSMHVMWPKYLHTRARTHYDKVGEWSTVLHPHRHIRYEKGKTCLDLRGKR